MTTTDLPTVPTVSRAGRTGPRARGPVNLALRKPTGVSPWPIMLLAGGPKADSARFAAIASASDLIDRTLWVSWKERTPDALGATPGARFEIVDHDGTLDAFEDAIAAMTTLGREKGGKPHMLVIDGVSQLADAVRDWARTVTPGAGYWLTVGERWRTLIETLRKHAGPVLLIARHDAEGVVGHRDLPADVDVFAEVRDDGIALVNAPRTEPALYDVEVLDIETVWLLLKLAGAAK
ncbi:hypothetical protein [Homoserinibacter sp. GY 40078]|uniref:hypothetical protein n=1 Tax=Homoserinibacter sp. GY 40078 TaxID=2603275 RepID=UPI0011C956A4|nr:hypothetical protein [Homoserinibacter sp. GY 40078]TXK17380.1 hypothetical protein FVQ89_11135 [Homoserinibacter sp. GY 40078]